MRAWTGAAAVALPLVASAQVMLWPAELPDDAALRAAERRESRHGDAIAASFDRFKPEAASLHASRATLRMATTNNGKPFSSGTVQIDFLDDTPGMAMVRIVSRGERMRTLTRQLEFMQIVPVLSGVAMDAQPPTFLPSPHSWQRGTLVSVELPQRLGEAIAPGAHWTFGYKRQMVIGAVGQPELGQTSREESEQRSCGNAEPVPAATLLPQLRGDMIEIRCESAPGTSQAVTRLVWLAAYGVFIPLQRSSLNGAIDTRYTLESLEP